MVSSVSVATTSKRMSGSKTGSRRASIRSANGCSSAAQAASATNRALVNSGTRLALGVGKSSRFEMLVEFIEIRFVADEFRRIRTDRRHIFFLVERDEHSLPSRRPRVYPVQHVSSGVSRPMSSHWSSTGGSIVVISRVSDASNSRTYAVPYPSPSSAVSSTTHSPFLR